MRIIQVSCKEANTIDLRQANAVIRHMPDAIIWEAPIHSNSPDLVFNKFPVHKKPKSELQKTYTMLSQTAKRFPWVRSDIAVYKNIEQMWHSGHNVMLYHVDAPSALLEQTLIHSWNTTPRPHRRGTHFLWWVYIYIREKIMAQHIAAILKQYRHQNSTVLVFMEKFHWRNVQFRLQHPRSNDIFKFYFGKFKNMTPRRLEKKLQSEHQVLYTFWKKYCL